MPLGGGYLELSGEGPQVGLPLWQRRPDATEVGPQILDVVRVEVNLLSGGRPVGPRRRACPFRSAACASARSRLDQLLGEGF